MKQFGKRLKKYVAGVNNRSRYPSRVGVDAALNLLRVGDDRRDVRRTFPDPEPRPPSSGQESLFQPLEIPGESQGPLARNLARLNRAQDNLQARSLRDQASQEDRLRASHGCHSRRKDRR